MYPDIKSRFEKIQSHKQWFANQAEQMGVEAAGKRVNPDEWSLTEVIEHLVIAERNFTPGFEQASAAKGFEAIPKRIRRKVVLFVLRNAFKVPTPSDKVVPKGVDTLETLLPEWNTLRERTSKSLDNKSQDQLNYLVFKHPRAGDLNLLEALDFLDAHMTYHRKRAKQVFGFKD
jgi:uncharacterized damage-inducible protein DinB